MKKLKLMGHKKVFEKDLTQEEFNKINKALIVLKRIMAQESLYDQVLESLISFKSEMYEYNLRSAQKFLHGKYIENYEIRSSLNRLAFNLLNFGKLYLDKHYHSEHNRSFVLRVTGDIDSHTSIVENYETLSDNSEYLLGYKLRNYVQHDALPIGILRKKYEENISKFTNPLIKNELKKGGIPNNLLAKFDDEIDLHTILEAYVHVINQCHKLNRKLVENSKKEAISIINFTSQMMNNECAEKNRIVEIIENVKNVEKKLCTLNLGWFDVVNYLEEKNKVFIDWKKFEFKGHSK